MSWLDFAVGIVLGIVCDRAMVWTMTWYYFRAPRPKTGPASHIPFCSLGMTEKPKGVADILKSEARTQARGH